MLGSRDCAETHRQASGSPEGVGQNVMVDLHSTLSCMQFGGVSPLRVYKHHKMSTCADVFAAFRSSLFSLLVGLQMWILRKAEAPATERRSAAGAKHFRVRVGTSTVLGFLGKLVCHTINQPL